VLHEKGGFVMVDYAHCLVSSRRTGILIIALVTVTALGFSCDGNGLVNTKDKEDSRPTEEDLKRPRVLPLGIIENIKGRAGFAKNPYALRSFSARIYNDNDFYITSLYLKVSVVPKPSSRKKSVGPGKQGNGWNGIFNCSLKKEISPYTVTDCDFDTIEPFDSDNETFSWTPTIAYGYPNPYLDSFQRLKLMQGKSIYELWDALDSFETIKEDRDKTRKELEEARMKIKDLESKQKGGSVSADSK
jgi:hypothetical protein